MLSCTCLLRALEISIWCQKEQYNFNLKFSVAAPWLAFKQPLCRISVPWAPLRCWFHFRSLSSLSQSICNCLFLRRVHVCCQSGSFDISLVYCRKATFLAIQPCLGSFVPCLPRLLSTGSNLSVTFRAYCHYHLADQACLCLISPKRAVKPYRCHTSCTLWPIRILRSHS